MHWNWFNMSSLANFVTALILGSFVYLKNRKIAVNRVFGLMSLFIAFWAGATYIWSSTDDFTTALFWARVANLSALFISVFFLHFIIELLGQAHQKRVLLKAAYAVNIALFILVLLFPMLFVGGMAPKSNFVFYTDRPGFLYYIFTFIFFAYGNYVFLCMLKAWKTASGLKRTQIKYSILSSLFGFVGGGSTFLLVYNIPFPPYPNILMSLWTIILAYAIVRYRYMDIETVIHRTILWLLTSSLILIPLGTMLYFTRPWLAQLHWIQLTFATTGLFYVYLYYYHKMQPRIDHLFRRRKYDYQTILGKVAEKIATTINIDELAQQLLTEICEAMYLRNGLLYVLQKDGRKYSLIGRRGYQEINGIRQRNTLEMFKEDDKSRIPVGQKELDYNSCIFQWLSKNPQILEKEQIEVDPQYETMKREALAWFKEPEIDLIVPLVFENKTQAILGLGKKENLQSYISKDIELLKKLGEEAGVTVFNLLHYKDLLEKERLEDEMRMGRGIQMGLLPSQTPKVKRLMLEGLMEPAKEIGGDYYDFITFSDKEDLAVVIGDVSGKGVAAGLLMSMVKASIFTLSEETVSPKALLIRLNSMLYRSVGSQKFMTLLYLLWRPETQTLAYSSAGHEHILIFRNNEQDIETIQSGGFMLGVLSDIESFLEEKELKLEPKDKILLYTDGVTEAENSAGDRFGLAKLKDALKRHSSKPAAELIQAIRDEVYGFIGSHPQYDDITLVVLEAV